MAAHLALAQLVLAQAGSSVGAGQPVQEVLGKGLRLPALWQSLQGAQIQISRSAAKLCMAGARKSAWHAGARFKLGRYSRRSRRYVVADNCMDGCEQE